MYPLSLTLAVITCSVAILSFLWAVHKAKHDRFYSDTLWLVPWGVFVWGDALILGPFWMLASVLFLWWPPIFILRFYLFFYAVRSAYEVVYWINHQVAHREYNPPFFRRITWLKPNDSAILYQLLNMCQCILAFTFFALTWR